MFRFPSHQLLRFILVFILVLLLRPSSPSYKISYAYACIAKTAHVHFTHGINLVLFWLVNIQFHLRVAYKMVWLMVVEMSGLVYMCEY